MNEKADNPKVLFPPPLIFMGGLLLGLIGEWLAPFQLQYGFIPRWLGLPVAIAGAGIILLSWQQMREAKTNIQPWKPTIAVIDQGLYSFSRNPIYLAMAIIYIGAAFLIASLWPFAMLPVVLLVVNFGVVSREEKYLEAKFGEEYLEYKARVRRWL